MFSTAQSPGNNNIACQISNKHTPILASIPHTLQDSWGPHYSRDGSLRSAPHPWGLGDARHLIGPAR